MSEQIIQNVVKEPNILFNLLALKHKCLLKEQMCNKCRQVFKNWSIIDVCHHILCNECMNLKGKKKKRCPACNIKFNPTKVKTDKEMKMSFSEIEETVFHILSVENGTSDALYPVRDEDNNVIKLDVVSTEQIEPPRDKDVSEETNNSFSQLSNTLFDEIQRFKISEESNYRECNGNVRSSLNSNGKKEPLAINQNSGNSAMESTIQKDVGIISSNIMINNLSPKSNINLNPIEIESTQDKDVELIDYDSELSCDLFDETLEVTHIKEDNFKESANENLHTPKILNSDKIIELNVDVIDANEQKNNLETTLQVKKYEKSNMSTEQEQDADISSGSSDSIELTSNSSHNCYSSSGSESESDVIEGTPDRSHVSNSSRRRMNDNIVITYSNLKSDEELDVLRQLIHVFEIHAHTDWSDKITHLVVKTIDDNYCMRTKKYMNAILGNCFIVTFDWAKDSLSSKSLQPEVDYIPLDMSGEPSPMVSWRVGRGIIDSPLEWTKTCILYFHSSVEFNEAYSDVFRWAKQAGFIIADEIEEFKREEFKMRIVIAFAPEDGVNLPDESEIKTWLTEYKAFTLYLEWFLECLFRYKFVEIIPRYQVSKLDPNGIDFLDIDKSMFQFE